MVQIELFPDEMDNETDTRLPVGNGYSVEWLTHKIVAIYYLGVPYKKVEINAQIDKRRLVVELILEAGAMKSRVAEALDCSRTSIDNWLDTFTNSGFEGLVNSYKGRIEDGRKDTADKLPKGNKARRLEAERRAERERLEKQQLLIDLEDSESGDQTEQPDMFDEVFDFQENRYAGGFLYWAIFQDFFGFMKLCNSYLGKASIIIYLYAMMLVHKIGTVEQLKTVYKLEFGKILGLKKLFSKPLLSYKIRQACSLKASKSLIEGFFKNQARKGLVALYWLYIDGHFIPYYGKEKVHSGYYTQREKPMPGQTEIFVHDCNGKIVYFEIQEGKGNLKQMMRDMSEKWCSYIDDERPLIIADRESWGVDFFISMKGYRFLTWEKHSKKDELDSIADDDFSSEFEVNKKKYRVFEEKKTYSNDKKQSIELRRIVIWNLKTGKRSACVAQNEEKEDAVTLARAMLGRWGCSENSFKHMGDRFNMHYNPVYDTLKESDNQSVANPEYESHKKAVAALKRQLSKCERDLGRMPMKYNKDGKLRKSKKRDRLFKMKEQLKVNIETAKEELKNCPERVGLNEIKPEKSFKELDTEGKNLWDLAQSLVWNSRKKLIEMLKEFLPNPRDLIPVLEAITKGRGWIRSSRQAIEIRLEPLERPRFKSAQIQLCRALNEKRIRLQNGKRLMFDVGPAPN